jgi:hypothetical protein
MSSVHKIEWEFKLSAARNVRIFVLRKSGINETSLSFEDLSAYKIVWSHVY